MNKKNIIFRRLAIPLIVLVMFFLVGCPAYHLRDAQDTFREGAKEEWGHRYNEVLDIESSILAQNKPDPQRRYQEAFDILNEILEDKKSKQELIDDNLLGTALTLKAVCRWKLMHSQNELKNTITLARAQTPSAEQISLLNVLPEFRHSDYMAGQIESNSTKTMTEGILFNIEGELLAGEMSILSQLRKQEKKDKTRYKNGIYTSYQTAPWRTYLLEAQLNTYVLYFAASNKILKPSSDFSTEKQERDLKKIWKEYLKTLKDFKNQEAAEGRRIYMKQLLGNQCHCMTGNN